MAEKVTLELEVKTGQTVEALNEVEKEIKDINSESADLNNTLDTLSGGAITKFKKLKSSIGGAIKGFKSLRVAIIATGIGALVIAVTSLTTAFSASEEGQNKLAKITTKLGVIFGNLTDILANVGESFWSLGEAIGNFITGDFKAAGEAFDEFKGKVNETTEAIKNFGEETRKELQLAGQIADLRAAADKQERKLIVERAKANAKIIELRSKNEEKDKFTAEQRIGFLQEAMVLEKEIANQEIELASKRFEAKKLENSLSKSTKEDLREEAELEAELLNIRFASDTRNKELIAQVRATREEIKTLRGEATSIGIDSADATFGLGDIQTAEIEKMADTFQIKKNITEQEIDLYQQKVDAARMASDAIMGIAKEETAFFKVALIAKQLLNAKEMVMEVKKTIAFSKLSLAKSKMAVAEGTAQTAKIGFPQNIPMLIGYAAQTAGIISAISGALKGVKGAGSIATPNFGVRGSSTTVAQAPQFNLVGSSGTNQLASAIGSQSQQPIKAYVVGSEVTTQQAMDRQISSTASLGDDD